MTAAALTTRACTRRRTLRLRLRKYGAAFRVSLLSQLAYPAELWLRSVFVVVIMFIFSSLWHTTFAELGRATLGGFTLGQMLWYLALTESILLSRPRDALRIDEEVRTGQLAYQLARPYNYVLYRFVTASAERLPRFLITLVIAGAMATAFSGELSVRPASLLAGLPVLALALAIDYCFVLSISLLAFWVEDASPVLFIYDRLLMLLGGMLLPLSLFPGALATVARALPFSTIVYDPASVIVSGDGEAWALLVLRQVVTLAVALMLALLFFRYAVRRLQTNGG